VSIVRIVVLFAIVSAPLTFAIPAASGASLCTVSNVSALAFETIADADHPYDARASFVLTCARTQTTTILLLYSHHMKGARGEDLNYDLYSSSNHAAIWGSGGDGAPVSQTVAGGHPTTIYIYARIESNQRAAAGHFTDAIEIEALPF
jgi:spore coat protein U-like protein